MPARPTDHLANERTFLAWIRTAVTIMAFGFVVARFGLLLRELGSTSSVAPPAPISQATGVLLVLAGSAILVVAFLRFLATRSDLERGQFRSRSGLEWAITVLMVLVGVGLAAYLLATG